MLPVFLAAILFIYVTEASSSTFDCKIELPSRASKCLRVAEKLVADQHDSWDEGILVFNGEKVEGILEGFSTVPALGSYKRDVGVEIAVGILDGINVGPEHEEAKKQALDAVHRAVRDTTGSNQLEAYELAHQLLDKAKCELTDELFTNVMAPILYRRYYLCAGDEECQDAGMWQMKALGINLPLAVKARGIPLKSLPTSLFLASYAKGFGRSESIKVDDLKEAELLEDRIRESNDYVLVMRDLYQRVSKYTPGQIRKVSVSAFNTAAPLESTLQALEATSSYMSFNGALQVGGTIMQRAGELVLASKAREEREHGAGKRLRAIRDEDLSIGIGTNVGSGYDEKLTWKKVREKGKVRQTRFVRGVLIQIVLMSLALTIILTIVIAAIHFC